MTPAVISTNIEHKISIMPHDKHTQLTLTLSDAESVAMALRRFHCSTDIIERFSNTDDYSYDAIENGDVMTALLDSYVKRRENADGGEIEDSMHWSECLSKAIEDNADILEKYRLERGK